MPLTMEMKREIAFDFRFVFPISIHGYVWIHHRRPRLYFRVHHFVLSFPLSSEKNA